MNRVLKSVLTLGVVGLLAACGNGQSGNTEHADNHEGHNHATEEQSSTQTTPPASVNLKDDKLNAVYQHYIHLTTALTNKDAAEAKIAAAAIEAGAKETEGGASIASAAAKITSAPDLEAQRREYSALSNDFIALVKKSGLNSGELYVDYCPMALNDEGAYWLSNKKEIRNPYFGDEMLTCGSVKETIK